MSNPYRVMCAELTERLEWFIAEDETNQNDPGNQYWLTGKQAGIDSVIRARALLAQPVPEGPTDEELVNFRNRATADCCASRSNNGANLLSGDDLVACQAAGLRAVLAKYGSTTPQPVPVSERLPRPEDCTAQGWCWVFYRGFATWTLEKPLGQDGKHTGYTHWLPANALPTPEAKQ